MSNIINVINTISSNINQMYQTRIPTVTANNIENVGTKIMESPLIQNAFVNALVNKVAMTIVRNKTYNNTLQVLKKGGVPLGQQIEEIMVNPAKAMQYDETGDKLFKREKPDVKVLYHKMNRQNMYKVTISQAQLIQAFRSLQAFEQLINVIVSTLYSGDNIDEYLLMRNLLGSAVTNNLIKKIEVDKVVDTATTRKLVSTIKKASKGMILPTSAFNSYNTLNPDETPVTTWTPVDDQILILQNDISVDIDMETFATAFNIEYAKFKTQSLEVDSFGENTNCYAILCDKSFIQVYDNLQQVEHVRNGEGLYDNYMFHHWQTYSLSLFSNAVAICYKETV